MIKNIVFDLGNVLVEFVPSDYLKSLGYNGEEIKTLTEIIFGEKWNRYDRGDYKTVADMRAELCSEYPKYSNDFHKILKPDWVKIHKLKTETIEWLYELKKSGYKIYILSNLSFDSFEYLKNFDFLKAADGGVFSFAERACKPDEKLYRILLERYSLKPDETVFFDDRQDNIGTAAELGINGIVFKNVSDAKRQLEVLLYE